ncbi:LTA synthase family protein [Dysgonomonas sp. 511]|uniref:LTA synthase family protein n=1 Tax=Dysgonomonas sp. 511 TaxID=2302930 RepID=UPI0013D3FB1C|nr:LTA synthase family protein [Dysgonomonas sp. 511]NDV78536.1 LTA synthase family protein [Dysgonomonas sp. 511]
MKNLFTANFKLFFVNTIHAFLVYCFLLLLFAAFRLIILFFFNSSPEIYNETGDLLKAFFMGFRFDTMVICYGLLPVVAFNFIGIFMFGWGEKYFAILKKVYHVYYTILILAMLLISVIDLYFYNFFMTRISVLIFGFVEDDTAAVIKAIWTDYPVIPIAIGLIVAGWLAYKLVGIIQKIKLEKLSLPLPAYIIFLPVLGFFFLFGIRGNFAFYPLRINDAIISQYVFINNLVPNGVYALKTAFKDRKEQNVNINVDKTMKKWGFDSPAQAVSLYTGSVVPESTDSLKAALTAHTPVNEFLEQNPPNVVFIQMESMSEHFISLHEKENFNLLGALDDVLSHCLHFTHFLSATDATVHTLEGILLNSPMTPVSQSLYMDKTLETSAAKPFKEKGYHTAFVTGSKLGWRNLDKFVPNQYFDQTEGSAHIEKFVPNVLSNEWGCYDEFMFTRIFDILQQKNDKPQFVFGLTITNHTPYSLPDTYKPYPIHIPEALKSKLSSGEEHAQVHFTTYQYANDCLGKFISAIKNSPLGENTIIAASGDHSARRVFDYPDANMLQKYAVPLILYIPEKYKENLEMPDTRQFASHKDIFPTIYNLALSGAAYVRSGINLFDKEALGSNFAISSYKLAMNNHGCIFYEIEPVYYIWSDENRTELKPASESDIPQLKKDMEYAKAYTASMTYLVQEDLREKSQKKE